jgi:hypothetical protein
MRYATLLIAIVTLGLSGQAVAFGDEPSPPTASAAPASEKAKEPTLLDKVEQFKEGKSTYSEVVQELKQPDRITTMPDNTKHAQYSKFGYFSKGYFVVLIFDDKDVLKAKMITQQ